jgi:TolA-binding protein
MIKKILKFSLFFLYFYSFELNKYNKPSFFNSIEIVLANNKSNNTKLENNKSIENNINSEVLKQIKNQIELIDQRINRLTQDIEEIKFQKNYSDSVQEKEISDENYNLEDKNDENYYNEVIKKEEDTYQDISIQDGEINKDQMSSVYLESIKNFQNHNYDKSLSLLEKIVDIKNQDLSYDNEEMIANSYLLIGEILFKKPDFHNSAINFLKSYKVFKKINKEHIQTGNSLLRLAQALYLSGDKDSSCKAFSKLYTDFKNTTNSEFNETVKIELTRVQCDIKK